MKLLIEMWQFFQDFVKVFDVQVQNLHQDKRQNKNTQ